MDPSPEQLHALLTIVTVSLVAVVAAIIVLVRSGRIVQFPGGPEGPLQVGGRRGGRDRGARTSESSA